MVEQPYVSIVTPVYNGELYLAECIESVLCQTHHRFEYIIANNGSTDGSLAIARSYEKRDGRIRVYDNDAHLGQVDNINQLLRRISPDSRYCKLVFADDWLYPECIERMTSLGETHASVGIVSSYYLWGDSVMNVGLTPTTLVYRGSDICRRMLLTGGFFFGTPSVILWRTDLIRSRADFYSRDSLHEDTEACYEFLHDWDFGFVPQVLAYVRRGNVSITASHAAYGPDYLDYLINVRKFGPSYLSPEEYERKAAQVEKSYMMFLGKSVIRREGRSFWRYHRAGLGTIGGRLSAGKLFAYSALAGLDLLFNPKHTIQALVARCRGLKDSPLDADDNRMSASQESRPNAS